VTQKLAAASVHSAESYRARGHGGALRPTGRATIKDVARAAGVSVTTVSHVFNATRPVAPETEQRVRAAIDQLGYHPSSLARALRGERTGTVGMLVASSTNPFFAEVIKGMETRCFERGYSLVLCNTGDDRERLAAHLATLIEKRIDGLALLTTNADPRFYEDMAGQRSLPLVAIDTAERDGVSVVNDDSRLGGTLAAKHLLARGYRRIGVLAGPTGHPRARQRLQGFSDALAKAGVGLDPGLVQHTEMTLAGGSSGLRKLSERLGRPPQALFCVNDLTAIGAIHALAEAGLDVPADVAVVGYDDIEMAAYCRPPLTTVRQPTEEIGRSAADTLIDQIEKGAAGAPSILLTPVLVERQSVGRLHG